MRQFRLFFALFCIICLVGCSRLTVKNFEAIQPGMTKKDVKRILGTPIVATGDRFLYKGPNLLTIEIGFQSDVVVDKFYQDENTLLGPEKPKSVK